MKGSAQSIGTFILNELPQLLSETPNRGAHDFRLATWDQL